MESVRMAPPQNSTTAGVRQSFRGMEFMVTLSFQCRVQGFEFVQRVDQRFELFGTDARSNRTLCALPMRRGLAQGTLAGSGQRYRAPSRVLAADHLDPSAFDERLEIAGERGAIEEQRRGERGHRL